MPQTLQRDRTPLHSTALFVLMMPLWDRRSHQSAAPSKQSRQSPLSVKGAPPPYLSVRPAPSPSRCRSRSSPSQTAKSASHAYPDQRASSKGRYTTCEATAAATRSCGWSGGAHAHGATTTTTCGGRALLCARVALCGPTGKSAPLRSICLLARRVRGQPREFTLRKAAADSS